MFEVFPTDETDLEPAIVPAIAFDRVVGDDLWKIHDREQTLDLESANGLGSVIDLSSRCDFVRSVDSHRSVHGTVGGDGRDDRMLPPLRWKMVTRPALQSRIRDSRRHRFRQLRPMIGHSARHYHHHLRRLGQIDHPRRRIRIELPIFVFRREAPFRSA